MASNQGATLNIGENVGVDPNKGLTFPNPTASSTTGIPIAKIALHLNAIIKKKGIFTSDDELSIKSGILDAINLTPSNSAAKPASAGSKGNQNKSTATPAVPPYSVDETYQVNVANGFNFHFTITQEPTSAVELGINYKLPSNSSEVGATLMRDCRESQPTPRRQSSCGGIPIS